MISAGLGVFHTTRIELTPVGGSTVTGTVVDIHTQGPRIYAQERYQLRGAVPGATYTVTLTAYADATCTAPGTELPGSPSTTANRAVNAVAKRTFPAPGPGAGEAYLRWRVVQGGTVVAQTACVTVPLD